MKIKPLYIVLFVIVIIAQWLVPMQMIQSHNDVLETGKIYKFRIAPIDPYDAFRGKFIDLNFVDNRIVNIDSTKYDYNQEAYVTLKDSAGYAILNTISKLQPNKTDYLKVKVNYPFVIQTKNCVIVDFYFNRFYMNEFKAKKAEEVYANSTRDLKKNVYALVAVKNGKGIVKDVIIDNMSISKYIQK